MSGWFAVQRNIFDHDLFMKEPFTEREAWMWIISKAAYEQTSHRIANEVLTVERGSFYCTQRELAATWQWGTTKVRSFLNVTQSQNMISIDNKTKKTLISVCNYEVYQSGQGLTKTQTKQPNYEIKTQPKHSQNTKEEINNLTTNNNSSFHSELSPNQILPKPLKNPSIKKSAIPENWEPDQACIDKAYAVGMDRNTLQVEAENFRNHHFNKQSKMVKWEMAFGTWCNNWKKFNANSKPNNVTGFPQSGNPRRRSDVEIMIERGNALRERGL